LLDKVEQGFSGRFGMLPVMRSFGYGTDACVPVRHAGEPAGTSLAFLHDHATLEEVAAVRMQDDDDRDPGRRGGGSGTGLATRTKTRVKRPSLYRVLLLNDDFTPMEFVIHVLERFFNKNRDAATVIMLHVHKNGVGECGIYTYEIAETKVTQVMDFARKHQHPLQCVMEKQ